jgi:hypothetical protein
VILGDAAALMLKMSVQKSQKFIRGRAQRFFFLIFLVWPRLSLIGQFALRGLQKATLKLFF